MLADDQAMRCGNNNTFANGEYLNKNIPVGQSPCEEQVFEGAVSAMQLANQIHFRHFPQNPHLTIKFALLRSANEHSLLIHVVALPTRNLHSPV